MSRDELPSVSVTEAAALMGPAGPALIVDVREAGEFAAMRVAGAALVPISRFGLRFRELPRDRPLLLFCRSGNRSAMATDFLRQQGFGDVRNVSGGIVAWRAAGLPVRSGPPDPGEGDLPAVDPGPGGSPRDA